jgi:hypothetical protein
MARDPSMARPRDCRYAGPMELEIRPEPPESVRRAIEAALADADEAEPGSAWWRAGVDESLADAAD